MSKGSSAERDRGRERLTGNSAGRWFRVRDRGESVHHRQQGGPHQREGGLPAGAADGGPEAQDQGWNVVDPRPEDEPVLDPQFGELRDYYDDRNGSDLSVDAASPAMEKASDSLSAERDLLARLLDQVAATRDAMALERDLLAAARDRRAESSAELDSGLTDRFQSAVDRDVAAGDRAASGLERRYAAEHRAQAAAARVRAADNREAADHANTCAEQRIDELRQSMEMSNTVGEAVGMIKQRHHLDSIDAVELLLGMCRSEGLDLEIVAERISHVRWLP